MPKNHSKDHILNQSVKNTGLLLVRLAVMFLLLHGILPHDHHYFGNYPFQDETSNCLYRSGETGAHPLHCHAFNATEIDRVSVQTVKVPNMQIAKVMFSALERMRLQMKEDSDIIFVFRSCFPKQQYFFSAPSLRAPPVICQGISLKSPETSPGS